MKVVSIWLIKICASQRILMKEKCIRVLGKRFVNDKGDCESKDCDATYENWLEKDAER